MSQHRVKFNETVELPSGEINQLKISTPILSVGIFFDGTSNNKDDPDSAPTNIAKLWSIYKNSPSYQYNKVYVRGVGTEQENESQSQLDDDWFLGKTWGYGAEYRISFVLSYLKSLYNQYSELNNQNPEVVKLDIFGFSRGSALARHFVNVINDKKISQQFDPGPQVRFLGIFDTVSSIGVTPESSKYNFHVDTSKAQYIYHLVAEDELRNYFESQSIKSGPTQKLPTEPLADQTTWMLEEFCPGVHSDIGGGYPAGVEEQGQSNNNLSRIYLMKMYETAKLVDVPLNPLANAADSDPGSLTGEFGRLQEFYKSNPGLRGKHMVLRCCNREIEILEKDLETAKAELESYTSIPYDLDGNSNAVYYVRERISVLEERLDWLRTSRVDQMVGLLDKDLGEKGAFNKFIKHIYEPFRGKSVHVSHFPYNSIIVFTPHRDQVGLNDWPLSELSPRDQKAFMEIDEKIFHRPIFFPNTSNQVFALEPCNSLLAYIKIIAINSKGNSSRPFGSGYIIKIIEDNLIINTELGAGYTSASGVAMIFCRDIDEAPSIKFRVEGKNCKLNIDGRYVEFKFPFDSSEQPCLNDDRYRAGKEQYYYKGYLKEFPRKNLGSPEKPLILHIREEREHSWFNPFGW